MKPLADYKDIHTHRKEFAACGDCIVSVTPDDVLEVGGTYSVGIHPWDSGEPISLSQLKKLVEYARDPRVVAIGECGFDRLRGGSVDRQTALFDFHAKLAKRVGKPLIIHSVRSDDLVLSAAKRHRPKTGEWIIHGFRGKPERAKRLLEAGLSLSLGKNADDALVQSIPPDRLYRESDEV